MKSLRLSLILYLVLLLVLAIGAVLYALYQTTYQTLEAKKESVRKFLDEENRNRRRDVMELLDNQVLRSAQTLASMAQSQWSQSSPQLVFPLNLFTAGVNPHGLFAGPLWTVDVADGTASVRLLHGTQHPEQVLRPLGFILNNALNPNGNLLLPTWIAAGSEGQLVLRLARQPFMKIRFAEDMLGRTGEGRPMDFFQIFNDHGISMQKSSSMGDQTFTLDAGLRDQLPLFGVHWDYTKVKPGQKVRRVTLKVPVSTIRIRVIPPPKSPTSTQRGAARLREFSAQSMPAFFIQYACATSERDRALHNLDFEKGWQQSKQELESAMAMVSLQTQVLWIGLAAFAASMVGGCWLVGRGLAPLRRLSEAVSRVSERDFRVPIDPAELPVELRPILIRFTQTLDMLKRAFAREKQASADISHELRTPLAALLTTIEVALRRPRHSGQYVEVLKEVHAIGRQMTQLVEQLLALARIDAGADSVRSQDVDVPALAQQCVSLVRPLAEARELSLSLTCGEVPHLRTDPGKLREVLINLLHNAIEYNRPHGRVEVTVDRQNGHLQVDVRDTGIGIPAKLVGHVFERFYRVDESRQADSLHAGVGLSIVKGYLELIGGRIAVESTEGQGSTFRVQLPIR
jgi:signal transduction histidine kinase